MSSSQASRHNQLPRNISYFTIKTLNSRSQDSSSFKMPFLNSNHDGASLFYRDYIPTTIPPPFKPVEGAETSDKPALVFSHGWPMSSRMYDHLMLPSAKRTGTAALRRIAGVLARVNGTATLPSQMSTTTSLAEIWGKFSSRYLVLLTLGLLASVPAWLEESCCSR